MLTNETLNEGSFPLVSKLDKETLLGHKGIVIWMTGLSGSGKTTLAYALEKKLFDEGVLTKVLDGDVLRKGLNMNLGFTQEDRAENIRRAAETAKQLLNCGVVVICSLITPHESLRALAENIIGQENFILYHVSTPIEVCEKRDVKGYYKRARAGEMTHFTGISDTFDEPKNALYSLDTSELNIEACVNMMFDDIYPLIIL